MRQEEGLGTNGSTRDDMGFGSVGATCATYLDWSGFPSPLTINRKKRKWSQNEIHKMRLGLVSIVLYCAV